MHFKDQSCLLGLFFTRHCEDPVRGRHNLYMVKFDEV